MKCCKLRALCLLQVCDTALNTAHNILMCAPTGAGKTNVAVLTILQAIGAALQPDGTIAKDKFKVPLRLLFNFMWVLFNLIYELC